MTLLSMVGYTTLSPVVFPTYRYNNITVENWLVDYFLCVDSVVCVMYVRSSVVDVSDVPLSMCLMFVL